jgi:hypothetical protein
MEPYLAVTVVPDSRSFRMHEGLRPGKYGSNRREEEEEEGRRGEEGKVR